MDFIHDRLGGGGKAVLRIFADLEVLGVLGNILLVAPEILATQEGEIELTGLPRWALSLPLFVSSFLVALDVALDLARAALGLPSRAKGHGAVL